MYKIDGYYSINLNISIQSIQSWIEIFEIPTIKLQGLHGHRKNRDFVMKARICISESICFLTVEEKQQWQ